MLPLSAPGLPDAEVAALQSEALAHLAGPFALFDADGRLVSANRQLGLLVPLGDPALAQGAELMGVLAAIGRHGTAANAFGYLDLPDEPAYWMPIGEAPERARDWRTPDGRWFRVHLRRMERGWVLTASEVTDFKRQEKDLAEARRRLQTVLDHMTDGVLLWDEEFRIVVANSGTARLAGFPSHMLHPGASMLELIRRQESGGEFGPPPATEAELEERVAARAAWLTRADGSADIRRTPAGTWIEVRTIPVAGGGTLLMCRDVTVMKQREEEARAARERLQTVLDHMTDGVVMWDADFIVQFFNKETLRVGEFPPEIAYPGVSVLEVMRQQDLRGEFGPPPRNAAELEARVRARAALLSRPGGVSYMRQTPSGKWLDVRSIPVETGGAVLMYRDVTELKQREQELAAARETQQLILDTMTDGVVLLDRDLNFKLSNAAATRFHGIPDALAQPGASGGRRCASASAAASSARRPGIRPPSTRWWRTGCAWRASPAARPRSAGRSAAPGSRRRRCRRPMAACW
jgi:PAS domain-containing protein